MVNNSLYSVSHPIFNYIFFLVSMSILKLQSIQAPSIIIIKKPFRNSALGVMLENKQIPLPDPKPINGILLPYYFVGDAAFPLRTYLMTPYSGRDLDAGKFQHNKELFRGRVCIENAFGILTSR